MSSTILGLNSGIIANLCLSPENILSESENPIEMNSEIGSETFQNWPGQLNRHFNFNYMYRYRSSLNDVNILG